MAKRDNSEIVQNLHEGEVKIAKILKAFADAHRQLSAFSKERARAYGVRAFISLTAAAGSYYAEWKEAAFVALAIGTYYLGQRSAQINAGKDHHQMARLGGFIPEDPARPEDVEEPRARGARAGL